MKIPAMIAPSFLEGLLDPVIDQVNKVPENKGAQPLRAGLANIKMEIQKYEAIHESTKEKIGQISGATPPLLARARAYQQIETILGSHQKFVEADVTLDAQMVVARKQKFDTLKKFGLVDAKNSDDFFIQLAEQDWILNNKTANSIPKKPNFVKRGALGASKLLVGVITGVSLDMMFNPLNLPGYTFVACSIGVGMALIMLHLVKEHAHQYQAATNPATKKKHFSALIAIVLIYMVAESAINLNGMIRVSQQIAVEESKRGASYSVGEAPANTTEHPSKWPLLVFSLGLVALGAWAAANEGRNKASREEHAYQLRLAAIKLKRNDEYTKYAVAIDAPNFWKEVKKEMKAPAHKPKVAWYRGAVGHLSKEENHIESRVAKLGHEVDEHAMRIQDMILALSNQAHEALIGQNNTQSVHNSTNKRLFSKVG